MRLSILLAILLVSSCTLKLKVRGKCEGGIEIEEINNTCSKRQTMVIEANDEPR